MIVCLWEVERTAQLHIASQEDAAAPSLLIFLTVYFPSSVAMDKPVCLIDTASDGKLSVQQSALQVLEKIQQPVVVVAVVGLYRTGKSYLMNRLAGKQTGFALGSTIESKTKGIWMWCVPHPTKAETTLVLLDTEGFGDVDKGDSKHDTRIFSLAVLLSSTLVLNSRGAIDNRAIEDLQYVIELTEYIKIRSPDENVDDAEFVQFFPSFIWAVRDFSLELKIDDKNATEDEYLEFALKLKPGSSSRVNNHNLPRECIRKYFPSRKCFTFPFPTDPEKISHLETLDPALISKQFLKVSDRFCKFIFDESQVKNLKDGYTVTGRVLGHLAKTYVDTISSGGVPCLENAVIAMAKIENEAAMKEGIDMYQNEMEKLKKSFPLKLNEITSKHQCFSLMVTQTFMKRSFRDSDGKYLTSLEEAINHQFDGYLLNNEKASEAKCESLLSDLSKPMTERINQGFYSKAGGYNLFCQDLNSILNQYNALANEDVKFKEVWDTFQKQMDPIVTAIQNADNKLTENEKIICEQRQQAVHLEMQIKAQEEKRHQLEKNIEIEKQNNEGRLKQIMEKMNMEMSLQKQEMSRAMESKLREKTAMMERGFQEKANQMNWEIQELTRKNNEAEERKSREFAQLIANMDQRNAQNIEVLKQQLEAANKMNMEMSLQKQEMNRAMESKLREKTAMMERDFQEKTNRMNWEIQELRKNNEAEERKFRELAQLIANMDQRNAQNNEVLKQQLEAANKMNMEMSLQKQEMNRAMESKLREKTAMMEKDFQEKTNQMNWEIQELRRKNNEAEERKSSEFTQLIANMDQRNAQNMEVQSQQHREQIAAINRRPKQESSSCSLQ
ncbi:hypothetical protein QQF64_023990 [Cirrhinus molitorella]|uniref:GB1/RHD3-type G domain-containing protein n=1 Tax=Cirrhinus molitorella TaxID=172907 RepID=A0ABR3NKM4_9TELE